LGDVIGVRNHRQVAGCDFDGREAPRALRRPGDRATGLLAPASRVLVLTRSDQNRVVEAIIAGASGYILKDAPPAAIISAVQATAAGQSVLSPQIAGKLLQHIREMDIPVKNSDRAAVAIRAALTDRELEIFTLLASGNSNPEIARELSLSTNTVSNHIASILAKLHLENREPHTSSGSSGPQRHFLTLPAGPFAWATCLARGRAASAYPRCVPIYEFECRACGERFEALVAAAQRPVCPVCGAPEPTRLFSPIAGAPKTGLRGAAARRSDSSRHSRDERLREKLANKRELRKQSGGDQR
jgi:putative FmdB family regulatory protein